MTRLNWLSAINPLLVPATSGRAGRAHCSPGHPARDVRSYGRTLVLAHLHACEPGELGVTAEAFHQLGDAHLRILHGRLLEQHRIFVERVEATLDRAFELGLGHALVAALLLDDRLLALQ